MLEVIYVCEVGDEVADFAWGEVVEGGWHGGGSLHVRDLFFSDGFGFAVLLLVKIGAGVCGVELGTRESGSVFELESDNRFARLDVEVGGDEGAEVVLASCAEGVG